MGTVVSLDAHRRRIAPPRPSRAGAPVELLFDLADPACYLAVERAERVLGRIRWVPATLPGAGAAAPPGAVRARMRARAARLGLPLHPPDRAGTPVPEAMRVAAAAIELGRGAEFVLAAARLAFCGGYDLRRPRVLAEAGAAAGLDFAVVGAAAADPAFDLDAAASGRWLAERGVDALPALRLGSVLMVGEERLEAVRHAASAGLAAER